MINYNLSYLLIYLTWNCNLRCVHCWIEAGCEFREYVKFEDIKDFLDQAMKMGVKDIRFTGGEPTMCWKTIKSVINYTCKYGVNYAIETNGSLLNKERIAFLKEHNVSVGISINGIDADEHDGFSAMPGAFDKTMKNLSIMKDLNFEPSDIVTSISRETLPSLRERIKFFDDLGFKSVKINIIQKSGRAEKMFEENKLLSVEDTIKVHEEMEKIQNEVKTFISLDVPHCMKGYNEFSHGITQCGINHMLCILPNLDIALCGYGTFDSSIILDRIVPDFDLENCWENHPKLHELRSAREQRLSGVCKKCVHFMSCLGSCRIKAYREYGRWDAPYPDCQYLYDNNIFPETRLLVR